MINTRSKLHYGAILFFVFLITPFLSISGIKNTMSANIYQMWQIVSTCCLLLLFFLKSAQIKLGWAIGLFVVYQVTIMFSSVYNNGISPGIITVSMAALLIFMLLQTDLYSEMLSAVSIIIVLALLINFSDMLQYSGESNPQFFIGGKNTLGVFLIPGMFLLLINALEKKGKVSKGTMLLVALSIITVFIGASGTGIVVAICTVLFLMLTKRRKFRKELYLGAVLAIYALVLLFPRDFFVSEYWLRFTDLLGKDGTLTSRTTIWSAVEDLIKENWLFGAGRGVALPYTNIWGQYRVTYEAHNFVLEILFEGGIIALVLFGQLFFKMVKRLNLSDVRHRTVFVAWCVLLINGLTESTTNNFLVMILLGVACRYASEPKTKKIG